MRLRSRVKTLNKFTFRGVRISSALATLRVPLSRSFIWVRAERWKLLWRTVNRERDSCHSETQTKQLWRSSILLIDFFFLNVKRLKQFCWRICCEWRWVISCQIKSLLWLWLDSCLCRTDSQPVLPRPGHGKQVVRTQESGQMGQEGQEISSQAQKVTILTAAHKYQTSLLVKIIEDWWQSKCVLLSFYWWYVLLNLASIADSGAIFVQTSK